MKRAFIGLSALVIVVLAVLVIAPGFVDWNGYKPKVQEQVKNVSGLDLQLGGDVSFALLPFPHLSIEDVTLKAPGQTQGRDVLTLEKLEVNVALGPLLKGDVQVDAVTIVKPSIYLEVLEDGTLSFITPEIQSLMSAGKEGETAAAMPAVSLEVIRIKDGIFSYLDQKSKTEVSIQNINADITAKSLLGPFEAEGSLYYAGKSLNFDVVSDAFDPETKTLSPEVNVTIQPDQVDLFFAGAVNFSEGFGVQGQFRAAGENLAETLDAYNLKDTGAGDVPYRLKGLLSADAEKVDFKNFDLSLGQATFGGSFDMKLAPLSYNFVLKSTQGVDIKEIYPGAKGFKNGALNISASGGREKITLHKSSLSLDGMDVDISGRMDMNSGAERPSITLDIETDRLDYDNLSKSFGGTSKSDEGFSGNKLRKIIYPQGFNLSFSSKILRYQGQDIKDVQAQLRWKGQGLEIARLSVKNYMKADISITGAVKNIPQLSGIDMNIAVNAHDVKLLAGAFNVDTASWPEMLGQANVKARLNGSADQMDVTTNISALKGEVIAQGNIKTPLEGPSFNNLTVQLKHPNMAEAIGLYTGVAVQDRNLAKPLDFYARVNQVGKSYKLEDIKGKLADATVQGSAVIDVSKGKPSVSGNLKFGKLALNTIVNKSGASSVQKEERWSREPLNMQALHALDADLTLSAASIDYGPWPLQSPQMALTLKDGTLDITRLEAGLFDGTVSMTSRMSAAEQDRQPLHIEGQAKLNNVAIGKLVKALSGTQLIRASGRVNVDTQIKTSGNSPAALVYDLGGNGTVSGQDIVLEGVDINRFARALSDESRPGDTVLGLWKGSIKGGKTEFDTLDGNFVISGGVVNIRKLDLDGARAAIQTMGNVNLPRWTLATKHKVIVKDRDDVPPFEILFSGSLDNPTQTFGQGLLQDYLSRKIQRKIGKEFENLLSDKLGLPGKDAAPAPENVEPAEGQEALPETPEQQEPKPEEPPSLEDIKPEDAIKDVLKGLLQ